MKSRIAALAFVSAVSTVAARQAPVAKQPHEALGVAAFELRDFTLPDQGWAPFHVRVVLGGSEYGVSFSPRSIRGANFQLLVQDESGAVVPVAAPPESAYQGTVDGKPGAVVAGTLVAGRLTALIRLGSGPGQTWSIHPLSDLVPGAPATAHVVSNDRDLIPGPWTCGVTEQPRPIAAPRARMGDGQPGGPDAFLACQISCDADYEFFVANGSNVTTTTNDISAVVNGMSAVYQADANVTFVLGTVIIRQSATQPYTSTAAGTLLDQFRNYWVGNQAATVRDIAHLFTGKELDGSTIGLAYLNVVCGNTFGYGLSQSRFSLNIASRVGVTSHEVGHNFSLGHCDGVCTPCGIMCSGIGGCNGIVTSFACSAPTLATSAQGFVCLSQFNNGLATPVFDTFATTTLDYNRWPTPANAGGVVNTGGVSERSAPNSLNLANTASITSAGIDLTGFGSHRAFVSFWTQHRGVENGETLAVRYRRTVQGDFLPLTTITSNGTDETRYWLTQAVLPVDGQGANATIRFAALGNQADDNWYIDDVKVSMYCRCDLNEDWALNIFDFLAYQTALSTLNTAVCDWDGDGFISTLDFNGFFNSVAAGCTGY